MKTFDRFLSYFLLAITFLFLGYFWAFSVFMKKDYTQAAQQIEIQIKKQLQEGTKYPFYITKTNIEITPWRDDSGVVRIKERR